MNALVSHPVSSTQQILPRPLVRIVIVGHVDHGKSTLIGRLLHETGSLPDGKMEHLKAVSARRGMSFEWAFLLDALQTERDQGITIDTSQIRFRTASRDFVLIDAPGHTEFLRNMITGAAQADAALLLIDASEGVREQTRRHGYLLQLLGVRQIAVVINKMDRVDFDPDRFRQIETEITAHLKSLGLTPAAIIPISARQGDGVAKHTPVTAWYDGPSVLDALDHFAPARPAGELALRLPVQAVYKFDERRIIAGRVETGRIVAGDEIVVMPTGQRARVRAIEAWPVPDPSNAPRSAGAGDSVGITLDREIFVDRGHVVSLASNPVSAIRRLHARVFWLQDVPLKVGANLTVRIGTAEARGTVTAIDKAVDPGQLSAHGADAIGQNHVGEIEIALSQPLAGDIHDDNPRTGRVVLETGGHIGGGGILLTIDKAKSQPAPRENIVPVQSGIAATEATQRFGHRGAVIWFTGLPASGKSTLARALERRVFERGGVPILLDGDTLRTGLNSDLGFTREDRGENVRRLAEVAAHLSKSGLIAIVAAVSPHAEDRARARQIAGEDFFEVHVSAPLDVCEERDPKGHYKKARNGALASFTGITSTYEPPAAPDLGIDTASLSIDEAIADIETLLGKRDVLR
jgi:bifunctional enzyme CysN/CysC